MFDALPESRGNGQIIAPRTFSTAVLAHGLMIAVLVSAAFLARVDAGEDPPLPYDFVRVISFLPEGANLEAGGGGKPEKPHAPEPPKKDPETTPEPRQPVLVETPTAPPTAAPIDPVTGPAAPEADPRAPASDGEGGLGGEGSGGGDGPGHGPGAGPGSEDGTYGVEGGGGPPADNIYVVTGAVESPVLIRKISPEYPEIARAARKEGNVILQAVIGTDGHVESVVVLKSEPLFDKAAIKAVSQWVYRPARFRGLPVKVFFTVYVEFRLN